MIILKKKTKPVKKTKPKSKTSRKPIKAVVLMSGGLDSAIAAKLVKQQGIAVHAVNFKTPFFSTGEIYAKKLSESMGIPFTTIELGKKYYQMLRKPKHGYGSALNPCVDCHIFMLKEARKYADKIGAKFIVTGEVLGQRPKSQQMRELNIIEKESGLVGKLLRPLSAKLLPKTEAEKKKWVDVSQFPEISGRSRCEQFILAKQFGIRRFQTPSGGCLLTYREYAAKVKDLLAHSDKISEQDLELLRIGRHFRFGNVKIIVGKNFEENQKLIKIKDNDEYYLEADDKIPSPITIIRGKAGNKEIETASQLTAFYSDAKTKSVKIFYGKEKLDKFVKVIVPKDDAVDSLRIAWK